MTRREMLVSTALVCGAAFVGIQPQVSLEQWIKAQSGRLLVVGPVPEILRFLAIVAPQNPALQIEVQQHPIYFKRPDAYVYLKDGVASTANLSDPGPMLIPTHTWRF